MELGHLGDLNDTMMMLAGKTMSVRHCSVLFHVQRAVVRRFTDCFQHGFSQKCTYELE